MDNTNYSLLSIVGIVALTAIIAMFVHADRAPSPDAPRVEFVDTSVRSSDAVLTGYVTHDRAPVQQERPRPEFDWRVYDYDNSGALDTPDALILADVVDRKRFCPPNKVCDLDGNGVVELRDLGLFNARLLEQAMQQEALQQQASRLTGYVATTRASSTSAPAAPQDTAFWAAVTGAPLQ